MIAHARTPLRRGALDDRDPGFGDRPRRARAAATDRESCWRWWRRAWLATVVRAPLDSVQGVIQKILYVHPPLAFAAYLGFSLTALGGALFLWRGDESWDRLARASAEVGVLFCTLVVVTGPDLGQGHLGPLVVVGPAAHDHVAALVRLSRLPAAAQLHRGQ